MFDKESMEKIVSAAVLSALEDKAAPLLAELIDRMLKLEVDMETGSKPSYSSKGKGSYLEFVAQQQVRLIVGQTVGDWIKDKSDEIKKQVVDKLESGSVAQAYVDALTKQVDNYGFRVDLTLDRE